MIENRFKNGSSYHAGLTQMKQKMYNTHTFGNTRYSGNLCLSTLHLVCAENGTSTNDIHHEEIEDMSTTVLTSASGSVALLESGYTLPSDPKEHCFAITTDKLHYSNDIRRWSANNSIIFRDGSPPIPLPFAEGSYPNYIEDTLRRFRAGEPPIADITKRI